jgi:hypothetical protein
MSVLGNVLVQGGVMAVLMGWVAGTLLWAGRTSTRIAVLESEQKTTTESINEVKTLLRSVDRKIDRVIERG